MAYIPSTPPPFDSQSPQHGALVQVVRHYREAGWFEHETGSDEKVADGARERWWAEWEDEVDTERTGRRHFHLHGRPATGKLVRPGEGHL